ncbi:MULTISPECIES: S1C family serine protease [unclassified Nocardioides]|uniref:S1C family serine protease n=1 Tax=unclassified Nocardioides TaxID=2615069 RepID=UPI00114E5234|nr:MULTISPECIES: trypsin-like peptidase domain-containing protein [unclassified Nocardioides]TQK72675.1 putative serine protease PepD [Nocardioides sp. SLBN-35]WGY03122.1 trypsin-like peptidase domain-containing protein [Nocardioides sp. QY071]
MTQFPPPPPFPPASFGPTPSPQRRPRRAGFAVAVLTGALVVGGGAGVATAAIYDSASGGSGGSGNTPLSVVDNGNPKPASGSVEAVAAAVLPSVVALDVSGGGAAGSGSGVVLDTEGLILTNDHVVTLGGEIPADQAEVTVSFNNGKKVRATVVGTDPLTDTALVKVEGVADLKPITIGKSSNLDVGEQVVAIGSPFGLDATVTSGIVSALDRPVEVARDAQGNATAYPAIQTDAAINPGNSGGPLVNMDGQLVGINASIRSTSSGQQGAESGSIGLGFAIPIDEVLPIIDQLRSGETPTHARLGIQVADVGGTAGSSDTTLSGARIAQLEKGSAAADAGLKQDDVITAIDSHQIDGSEALIATIRSYRPGDSVKVTYLRGGKESTTELKLGSDS